MSNFRLISFELCPYVQRSVMTLREKKVAYDIDYIDLSDRPDWFVELSPLGKVPVLEVTRDDGPLNYRWFIMAAHVRSCPGKRFVAQIEKELKERLEK